MLQKNTATASAATPTLQQAISTTLQQPRDTLFDLPPPVSLVSLVVGRGQPGRRYHGEVRPPTRELPGLQPHSRGHPSIARQRSNERIRIA